MQSKLTKIRKFDAKRSHLQQLLKNPILANQDQGMSCVTVGGKNIQIQFVFKFETVENNCFVSQSMLTY